MPSRAQGLLFAGALAVALLVHTAYLLWIWPRPAGDSLAAELWPYVASLLAGMPFAALFAWQRRRAWPLAAFLVGGFVVLWIYSAGFLCAFRNACL